MQRSSTGWKVLSTAGAFALLAGAAACGDDEPGTPDGGGVDGSMADAGTMDADMADAAPDPSTLRAGTIAVSEVALTNPGLQFKGAAVSITYTDLPTATVAPAFGAATPPLGGCSVWHYNVGTDSEPALADEGAVTISGGLTPIGTCVFSAAANNYICPFAQGAVPENTSVTPLNGQDAGKAQITWPTADEFAGKDVAGMFIVLDGFTNPENNGKFPITNKTADNTLVIANPLAKGESVAAGSAVTYGVFAGAGPTPANLEFLDATSEISVQKAGGAVVTSFDSAVTASGEGLTLDDASAQLHEFPADAAQELTFSCGGAGGTCGPSPEGGIYGFVLSGRTTDGDITGLDTGLGAVQMPAPVSKYAVFQCRGSIAADSLTIPQDAVQAILDTNPNRVEIRLLRITADLSVPQTSVVVGHGLVGYSDTKLSPPL